MSWGYKITLLILSFVCFMTFLVVSAFQQSFDLVAEDYYGKELKFEAQIEKQKNQQKMDEPISCIVSDTTLTVVFPKSLSAKKINGTMLFFRPSDAKKDVVLPITCIEGIQQLPLKLFSTGKYLLQIDYAAEGVKYYSEQTVMIRR